MNELYRNDVSIAGDIIRIYKKENTKEQNVSVCNVLMRIKNRKGMENTVEVSVYGLLADQVLEFCQEGTIIDVKAELVYKRSNREEVKSKGTLRVVAGNIQFVSNLKKRDTDIEEETY